MAKYKRSEPEEGIYELRDLAKGEFFRKIRKDGTPYGPVYTKGDYDRSEKAYDCGKYEDICESSLFKPAAKVYAGFTY